MTVERYREMLDKDTTKEAWLIKWADEIYKLMDKPFIEAVDRLVKQYDQAIP